MLVACSQRNQGFRQSCSAVRNASHIFGGNGFDRMFGKSDQSQF